MMDLAESHYYDVPRTLLCWIGLWPGDNTKVATVRRILSAIILIAGIPCLVLFILNHNFECVKIPVFVIISQEKFTWSFSLLSCTFLSIIFAFKYSSFYIVAPKIIPIMNCIKDDWATVKCEEELRIIEKYMDSGKSNSKFVTVLFFQPIVGFCLCSLMTRLLPGGNLSDTPRRYRMPFVGLWFEGKHYFIVMICWGIPALLGLTTIVATESSVLIFTKYACGMLSIACHRMRYALNEGNKSVLGPKNNLQVCDRLISAVSCYQRAIELADLITFAFAPTYIIFVGLGVASLSINLFRLSQEFMMGSDRKEFIICILFIASHFGYMFFGNYIAQQISNHSSNMFVETCDTKWYTTSLPATKLLLMIMQRTVKTYKFAVNGIFVGSLEGFSKLLSISFSYFMFMYNTH